MQEKYHESIKALDRLANVARFFTSLVPFGAAIQYFRDGDPANGALSLAGDALLFLGGWGAKLARAGKVQRARIAFRTAIAGEVGLAGLRAGQGVFDLIDGDGTRAPGYFGEAALRLLGASAHTLQLLRLRRLALLIPQGLTQAQFEEAARMIRGATGHLADDAIVQGSRATGTAGAASDIDFGLRLSRSDFERFVNSRYGTPNPGSNTAREMELALQRGRVHAGPAGLRNVRAALKKLLNMEVDIAVIQRGGLFDQGPFIPLPR